MSINNLGLITHRKDSKEAAVFFIHGFIGSASETWGEFPSLLVADTDLNGYDVYSWGYPTQLNLAYTITKYVWTDDPRIETIGQGLRTLLGNFATTYKKIVLIGHSMGGLVIQSFILEELLRGGHEHLSRLTEVILFGTPSGGLKKASFVGFLKNQIADMDYYGPFIQDLRSEWRRLIDTPRSILSPDRVFRLTLVAGMKDTFVPQESVLNPFPFDEKEIVQGNHIEMVKPSSADNISFCLVKRRLLRRTPTAKERALIQGEDEVVVRHINRIRAAGELGDIEDLLDLVKNRLAKGAESMPLVDRALGLALCDYEQYKNAGILIIQYLDFKMPGDGSQPFRSDAQAIQQLAIALSGAGDISGALARLDDLPIPIRNLSETMGIRAGRIKRQWLKDPTKVVLGHRAAIIYKAAFESAKAMNDVDQALYNGINYAYLGFVLGTENYADLAREVLSLCNIKTNPDYWTDATRAEAHLLLGEYPEALKAFDSAITHAPVPRHLSTTGVQALDILRCQGNPLESRMVFELINKKYNIGTEQNHTVK